MLFRRLIAGALLASVGAWGQAEAAACTGLGLNLPVATAANSVTFTDGVSYSLPILGINVQSSPGQISDCLVVATGSSGGPITTNGPGANDAYATPNGSGGPTYFRTGDPTTSPDPGGGGAFPGQTNHTWDVTLTALKSFLNGEDPVLLFNLNQTKSGSAVDENLFVWAALNLVNNTTGATNTFYVAAVHNDTGLPNFGVPGGDPTTFSGPPYSSLNTYPTTSDAASVPKGGACDTGANPSCGTGGQYMVEAIGQACLNGPVGSGTPIPCGSPGVVATVDQNLGANNVAFAAVIPELNALIDAPGFNPANYTLQIDLRMGCNAATITGGVCPAGSVENNGFEQLFIGGATIATPPPTPTPEPASLALLAAGLVSLGIARRGRA